MHNNLIQLSNKIGLKIKRALLLVMGLEFCGLAFLFLRLIVFPDLALEAAWTGAVGKTNVLGWLITVGIFGGIMAVGISIMVASINKSMSDKLFSKWP